MKCRSKLSSTVYLQRRCHLERNKRDDLQYLKIFQLVKVVRLKNYPTISKLLGTDEKNIDTKIKYTPRINSALINRETRKKILLL